MPKLFSGKKIVYILSNKYDFKEIKVKGSHLKMRRIENNKVITVIIPLHDEVKIGTFYNILRQAKIDKSDFLENI